MNKNNLKKLIREQFEKALNEDTFFDFTKRKEQISNYNRLPGKIKELISYADKIESRGFQFLLGYKDKQLIWEAGGYWDSEGGYIEKSHGLGGNPNHFTITSIGGKIGPEEIQWSEDKGERIINLNESSFRLFAKFKDLSNRDKAVEKIGIKPYDLRRNVVVYKFETPEEAEKLQSKLEKCGAMVNLGVKDFDDYKYKALKQIADRNVLLRELDFKIEEKIFLGNLPEEIKELVLSADEIQNENSENITGLKDGNVIWNADGKTSPNDLKFYIKIIGGVLNNHTELSWAQGVPVQSIHMNEVDGNFPTEFFPKDL